MAVPDLIEKQSEPVRLKMSYEEFLRGLTAGQIEQIQQLLRGEDAPGDNK